MRTDPIICDLDGTIADTRPANSAAYAAAFRSVGATFPARAYEQNFGLNFRDMMRAIAPDVSGETAAKIADEKSRVYADYFHLVRANAPLLLLLRHLRAAGHAVALATTARRANVVPLLATLGVEDIFDAIVTAEDVQAGKPAPDAYLLAAERLGADPQCCLVFEDSAPGIAAAQAAGCNVVKVAL